MVGNTGSGCLIPTPFTNFVTLDMCDKFLNSSKPQTPYPKIVVVMMMLIIIAVLLPSWGGCDDERSG